MDVGCGTGRLAITAQRQRPCAQVSGLDTDPAVLAIAARKARDAGADIAFDLGQSSSPADELHVAGLLPVLFGSADLRQVEDARPIPTAYVIVSLCRAVRGGPAMRRRLTEGTA